MKFYAFIGLLLLISCKGGNQEIVSFTDLEEDMPFVTVDYEGLESYLEASDAAVHVVNFWATWCKPCVKELPHFEELRTTYGTEGVKVILVSLDFPEQTERLTHFIEKRNIQSEVVFLDDGDANSWIPKVDVSWSGAIPATIIYSDEKRSFYEQSFTYEALEKELKLFL
ncbi:TlpA disulfide reductase family protein [uncultured Dokdonia sp.]|uniref:TlpA family protein disulfide reductase n=1 Tax=uncultured Dokdonia sp. TaxID=575653 RepID=UPI00260C1471|nr:TlpA disulfide reductase family protein [uncultured Dokdonia sp.]